MPPPKNNETNTLAPAEDSLGLLDQTDNKPPARSQNWPLLLVLVVCFGLAIGLFVERQPLSDWWRLRVYQPSNTVSALASADTMKPYTKHLFYLNRPQLLSTVTSFRAYCPENAQTIVLGCYHPDQNGIYIYNVPDPTLNGVTQVTAAHEVLHSVYARLSSSARKTLNNELQDYYTHGLSDARVKAEVKLYQQTEPNDVMDEMSCTFGTEIAVLPKSLEDYYQQFFTNRGVIVAFEQKYQGQFSQRLAAIDTYDQQLSSLKGQILSQEADLAGQLASINNQRNTMNQLLSSNQVDSYNAQVNSFNASINSYNSGVREFTANVDAYNQLVATRNVLAGQLTTLDKALDTRLTTQQTVH